jgi:hypothetical protein
MIEIGNEQKSSDFESIKTLLKSVKNKIGVRNAKSCNNLFNNRWADKTNLRIFDTKA